MNQLIPSPHFCNTNSKSPIRAEKPEDRIHPFLSDVKITGKEYTTGCLSVEFDKFNSRKTAESDKVSPPPQPNTSSASDSPSDSPAPRAGVSASADEVAK